MSVIGNIVFTRFLMSELIIELSRLRFNSNVRTETVADNILQEANQQSAAILKEAKDLADETIRNFHKYGKTHVDAAAMEKDREKVRKKLDKAQSKSSMKKKAGLI